MSPCSLEIRARPDSARGHTPKPALTLGEPCSSSRYSFELWGICRDSNCVTVCFGGGKGGHRTPPNASWTQLSTKATLASPVPLRTLKPQGFCPEQDSDLREKKDVCSLCAFAAPIFAERYKSSPTRNKTQYFWLREKYTHGTASGGFLKLFKGKRKGWWLPLGEQLLHLQFTASTGSLSREEDVWWQKPLSQRPRSSARSLYCTPKVAPGRDQLLFAAWPGPLPKGPLHTG